MKEIKAIVFVSTSNSGNANIIRKFKLSSLKHVLDRSQREDCNHPVIEPTEIRVLVRPHTYKTSTYFIPLVVACQFPLTKRDWTPVVFTDDPSTTSSFPNIFLPGLPCLAPLSTYHLPWSPKSRLVSCILSCLKHWKISPFQLRICRPSLLEP